MQSAKENFCQPLQHSWPLWHWRELHFFPQESLRRTQGYLSSRPWGWEVRRGACRDLSYLTLIASEWDQDPCVIRSLQGGFPSTQALQSSTPSTPVQWPCLWLLHKLYLRMHEMCWTGKWPLPSKEGVGTSVRSSTNSRDPWNTPQMLITILFTCNMWGTKQLHISWYYLPSKAFSLRGKWKRSCAVGPGSPSWGSLPLSPPSDTDSG